MTETTKSTNYQPTPTEQETLVAFKERLQNSKPSARVKLEKTKGKKPRLAFYHEDESLAQILLLESLATADTDFLTGLLNQVATVTMVDGEVVEESMNFVLSMIKGIEPRDPLETMLATQMAAIHVATIKMAKQLNGCTTLDQQDSASNAFNKLARTFTTQIEALKRYRSTGEQKVTVQHVTVNQGGQAVIGDVTTGAGGNKKEDLPHAKQITDAPSQTLPCQIQAVGATV